MDTILDEHTALLLNINGTFRFDGLGFWLLFLLLQVFR